MSHGDEKLNFRPRFGRFLLHEMGGVLVAVVLVGAGAFVLGESMLGSSLLVVVVLATLGAVYHAFFSRPARELRFCDDWVSGPCHDPGDRVLIRFDEVDWKQSGIRRRRLWIVARSGESIRVKLGWFSREQREGIVRAIRERGNLATIPESLQYA